MMDLILAPNNCGIHNALDGRRAALRSMFGVIELELIARAYFAMLTAPALMLDLRSTRICT